MSTKTLGLAAGRPSAGKSAATLASLSDKGATVRVGFDLSREDHVKLKIHAAKTGKPVADLLREAVAALLRE
jgi:hypothetical protein